MGFLATQLIVVFTLILVDRGLKILVTLDLCSLRLTGKTAAHNIRGGKYRALNGQSIPSWLSVMPGITRYPSTNTELARASSITLKNITDVGIYKRQQHDVLLIFAGGTVGMQQ